MKRYSKSHHVSVSELNLTPLLDLVVVLMMIFIITTPQLTNELELNLPTPAPPTAPATEEPKKNYIDIGQTGEVMLNQQSFELPALREILRGLRAGNSDVNVIIRGHALADYEMIVMVLDILQQVDIVNIGLATDSREERRQ